MRLVDTVRVGTLIRCPSCRNILGEEVAGLAVVRYKRRRLVALAVSCDQPRCAGVWIAPDHVEAVRRVAAAVPAYGVA